MIKGALVPALANAMAARSEYLSLGTEHNLGNLSLDVLVPIAEAVKDVNMPPHAANDAAWAEFELGETIARQYPDGDYPPGLDPAAFEARALDRWKKIYLANDSPALYRSRALLAIGMSSVSNTAEITSLPTQVGDEKPMSKYQIPAAKMLLNTPEARKHHEQDHELHCQTLIMLLMQYAQSSTEMIAVPAASRFRVLGSDTSYDMLLSVPPVEDQENMTYSAVHRLMMRSQDPGVLHKCIVIPPSALLNVLADPKSNHGTLRACLEIERMQSWPTNRPLPGKKEVLNRKYAALEEHTRNVHANLVERLGELARTGEYNLYLAANLTNDLDKAREWYGGLSGRRRIRKGDEKALETCINVYEAAFTEKSSRPEDLRELGELWVELSALPDQAGGYNRAADVFEEAAIKAEETQDWSLFIDAKIGAASARMHQAIQTGPVTSEQRNEYLDSLLAVGNRIIQVASTEKDSPHLPHLFETAKMLGANLAVNTDPDIAHLALFPTLRQQKREARYIGADLHILPIEEDDTFSLHNAGRIRFDSQTVNTFDSGISTVSPRMLRKLGWRDDLEMLASTLDETRQLIENSDFAPNPRIEKIRNFLLEQADATRFI